MDYTSKDIRSLYSAVDYLTISHKSALFMRGETQYLTSVTLWSYTYFNRIDNAIKEINEKFYFHYNFPKFATGRDISILRVISRREVGRHGHLAQSALKIHTIQYVLYRIFCSLTYLLLWLWLRIVQQALTIKYTVIGIKRLAICYCNNGLAVQRKRERDNSLRDYSICILKGICILKIAGTIKGITACKIEGIDYNLLKKIFKQAYQDYIQILYDMLKTIVSHEFPLKPETTIIVNLNIPNESIGCIIVSVGKTIQEIQKKTNTIITIIEKVKIFGKENNKINQATDCIKNITFIPVLENVYTAKVKLINEFGAVVEILPGKEYLLHISEIKINWERLFQVEDALKIGDFIQVKLMVIDSISKGVRALFPNI